LDWPKNSQTKIDFLAQKREKFTKKGQKNFFFYQIGQYEYQKSRKIFLTLFSEILSFWGPKTHFRTGRHEN
jgi:hypothetical protein